MPVASTADFVRTLEQLGLLEPDRLAELARTMPLQSAEPRALARDLLQRGWLTPYQVNQLLQGREQELVLGQYVLLERLGEGGMGQVFKARHQKLGRVVALKLMRKDRLDNLQAVRRFRREIQAAAQLTHPNIVLAFDADQVGDCHFFVMEFVEGTDLAQLVKRRGPLPVEQACECMRQAALGLQHAHERGLVHRDIKPSNLLAASRPGPLGAGAVKLLDLGLARVPDGTDQGSPDALTQIGKIVGTVDFLSPEQAMNSRQIDGRADLYSLGCTFYYLLTGQVPFPGCNAIEKLAHHRWDEPRPVEKVRPEVPAPVAAVLRKLMAKRPEARYQTGADLAEALTIVTNRNIAQPALIRETEVPVAMPVAVPVATPATESLDFSATRVRPRRRAQGGQWLLLAGGAALLVAGVFVLSMTLSRSVKSTGPGKGTSRVMRGSAGESLDGMQLRCAQRSSGGQKERWPNTGFRVVCVIADRPR
jgi:eukaryotic-like serine/threonine-protein kinase